MRVGMGGDLRQVGHAQDLVAPGEAHRLRPTGSALRPPIPVSTSSKTSVGVSSASARTCLIARATRDSSPPDAIRASGRAGSPGFGREPEDDLVGAAARRRRPRRRRSRRRARPRPAARRPSATSKTSGGKPSSSSTTPTRARRARRRPLAAPPTGAAAASATSARSARVLALAPGPLLVEAAQALGLGRGPLAVGDDRRLVVAVPPLQRVDRREALLERRERRGIVVDALGEVADLRGDVLELGLEAGQPLGDGLEAGIEPGQAAGLADGAVRSRRGRPRRRRQGVADAPPLRGRSPRRAGRRPAGPRISSASPGRRRAASISATSCSSRSRRRASSRGSIASAASAARFSRQRSTAAAIAARSRRVAAEGVEQVALPALVEQPLLVVLAVDLDERPDHVGEPRRGHRLRRRGARWSGRRPTTSRTAISGSGSRSNRASTRAASAPCRTRACRRARRARGRARR